MRLLLLSDIHSNLEALEACIAAAPSHDAVVNLGDIVGYGASPNEVTARARELGGTFVLQPLIESGASLTFFGHTHIQGTFVLRAGFGETLHPAYSSIGQSETCDFKLETGANYMINPGSVGQPRDGDWRAAFSVFDSDQRIVTFCRVPYDVRAAQDRILTANLPQRLATQLFDRPH